MILQITAAYKPAYIYGGPTMSVAKLCETLIRSNEQGSKSKEHYSSLVFRLSSEEKPATNKQGKSPTVHRPSSEENADNEQRATINEIFQLEVFTTTANGKTELSVIPNQLTDVDGVKVTYFTRLSKDHTHFSPALLWGLRKQILYHSRKQKAERLKQQTSAVHRPSFGEIIETKNEQLTTNNEQTNKGLIIHIHAWWNLVSLFSCAIAKWYQIPVVLSPRGMLTAYTANNRNSLAKKIIHSILGQSLLAYCHIHATSEKEKRDVLAIITPKSITVIPNLVQLGIEKSSIVHRPSFDETTNNEQRATNNDYRPSFDEATLKVQSSESKVLSPPSAQFTETNDKQSVQSDHLCNQPRSEHFKLIFLSRIEEKKGLEILFKALSSLQFDWSLTIAGSGEETYVESLKTKAESLKISDRINWIGQVTNEAKFKLLAEHDMMVLTSYNENFANVVIESLSVGTPILLSNEVGLADYVEVKKLGWITDLRPENIKHSIITAFESVNLRALIRETAPQIISKDFDSENLIQKYYTLYSQIN